jgi:aldose sugar dehydrogenase
MEMVLLEEVAPMQMLTWAAMTALLLPAMTAHAQTPSPSPTPALPDVVMSSGGTLKVARLARLELPWGMAFLPDGRLLITEKPGRLRIFDKGALSPPVSGLPKISYRPPVGSQNDQGGLLDVAVDPAFAKNGLVYVSYVEADETPGTPDPGDPRFGPQKDKNDNLLRGGAVARGKLDGQSLSDVKVIWRQSTKPVGRGHFGHRLVFAPDGKLFITSGDRMRFDPAQALDSNIGKVVRINPDGTIPPDNPLGKDGVRGEIWTVGHRNMLAAAVHPSGNVWVWEMGPKGGDELNILTPGKNYGWPAVSDGDNYDNSPIPDHPTRPEFEAPKRTWTPTISPSGALFYSGKLFKGWAGNAFVGGLSSKALLRFKVDANGIVDEERIALQRRIRDVIEASDGALLVIVDDSGELLRLTPQ